MVIESMNMPVLMLIKACRRGCHHRFHIQPYPLYRPRRLDCPSGRQKQRTFASKSIAQLASNEELSAIVNQFPAGVEYAFGYGSGVLRQQPSSPSQPDSGQGSPGMVDIILAIDNPYTWHKLNLQCHSDHYSLMARIGGPSFVKWLQVNYGAKLYFHPFVDINLKSDGTSYAGAKIQSTNQVIQRQIKYGAVCTDDLIQDLVHWDYLYLAGRMHKPIVPIKLPPKSNNGEENNEVHNNEDKVNDRSDEIEEAQQTNLLSAVSAALLLDSTFNHQQSQYTSQCIPSSQLYNTIASLSYTGDFRMQTGAEDPNKVKKLVETPGMLELWDNMYSSTLSNMQNLGLLNKVNSSKESDALTNISNNPAQGGTQFLEICLTDTAIRKELVKNLPPRLIKYSDMIVGASDNNASLLSGSLFLRKELAKIVSPAAKSQSMKGFFTAGVAKSWRYALAKFAKGSSRK